MRLLVVGDGRMGRAIAGLAAEQEIEVAAVLGVDQNREGRAIRDWRGRVDVAVEFTQPDAAVANIASAIDAGIPLVVGTTGWYDQRAALEAKARAAGGALLVAANFSIGVAVMTELVRRAGELLATQQGFDVA